MTPSRRDIGVAGGSVRVAHWTGANQGAPIVAFHGFTGGGLDFTPLASALQHSLFAPDLPGHGCTPALASDAGSDGVLDVLGAVVGNVAGPNPILFGYSMGGRLALHLARRQRVRALILVGASPGISNASERAARQAADADLAAAIEARDIAEFVADWERRPIIASQSRIAQPDRTAMRERRLHNQPTGLAWSLRTMGTAALEPLWGDLPYLQSPVLLITGAEDPKFCAIARQMKTAMVDAHHVTIADAGHCAHLEQPQAVAVAIRSFLEGR